MSRLRNLTARLNQGVPVRARSFSEITFDATTADVEDVLHRNLVCRFLAPFVRNCGMRCSRNGHALFPCLKSRNTTLPKLEPFRI